MGHRDTSLLCARCCGGTVAPPTAALPTRLSHARLRSSHLLLRLRALMMIFPLLMYVLSLLLHATSSLRVFSTCAHAELSQSAVLGDSFVSDTWSVSRSPGRGSLRG